MEKSVEVENFSDYSYLKSAMTLEELMCEIDDTVADLNTAAFTSTFDCKLGTIKGYEAVMLMVEDIINRLEECSPNPENDEFITKMYNMYDALEQLKNKCNYL